MDIMSLLTKMGYTISHNWFLIILLASLIQIAPIKLNPWSAIGRWFGRIIGVEALKKDVENLSNQVKENEAVTARTRILRFGDEMMNDHKHSQEHFIQILKDIDTYEKYCEEHPKFPNNNTVLTTKRIKEQYAECLEKHTFL